MINQGDINNSHKSITKEETETVIKKKNNKKNLFSKKGPGQMDSQQKSTRLSKKIYNQYFLNYFKNTSKQKENRNSTQCRD